jgi:hypothetical protein
VASKRRQRQIIHKGNGGDCHEAASTALGKAATSNHTLFPVVGKDSYVEDFEVIFNPRFEVIDSTTDIVRAIDYCKFTTIVLLQMR